MILFQTSTGGFGLCGSYPKPGGKSELFEKFSILIVKCIFQDNIAHLDTSMREIGTIRKIVCNTNVLLHPDGSVPQFEPQKRQ